MSENPYEAAYPTQDKSESKVPWLAPLIMAGAIFICVPGLIVVYRQRTAARERAVQAQVQRDRALQQQAKTNAAPE